MVDYRKIQLALQMFERLCDNAKSDHYWWLMKKASLIRFHYWLEENEEKYGGPEYDPQNSLKMEKMTPQQSFYHILKGLKPDERALFVKAVNRIRERGSFRSGNEAVKVMYEETESFLKENPESILIFRGTLQNYMVVGRCADMLFEKLGWQTATAIYEDVAYSCMMLSECSLPVIWEYLGHETSHSQLDFDYMAFEDEDCVTLALQQMMIDYARLGLGNRTIHQPTLELIDSYVTVVEQGIKKRVRFPFFELAEDRFCLFSSKGMPHFVVSDHKWFVGMTEVSFVGCLADMLSFMLDWYEGKGLQIGQELELFGAMCFNDFCEKKGKYPDDILIMDFNGTFVSYGYDAEWLAGKFRIPLWDRYLGDDESRRMVMMSEKDVNRIMRRCPKVMLDSSKMRDSEDRMALRPNVMNGGLLDETKYKKASVTRRKDGKYVIKATLNGKELPPTVLKKNLADLYVSYEKDGLKDLVMKQLLLYVYTWRKKRKKKK